MAEGADDLEKSEQKTPWAESGSPSLEFLQALKLQPPPPYFTPLIETRSACRRPCLLPLAFTGVLNECEHCVSDCVSV
jgi:hypothetical protein